MSNLDAGSNRRPRMARKSRSARLAITTLALATALALVVAACDAYGQPGGSASGASATGGTGAGPTLTLSVTTPVDGAEVRIPFEVTIESNVAIGPPDTGNHHLHLYFDGATASGDYDIVYSNTVQVTRELSPGEHTIVASLRNADHSDAGVAETITVTVIGSGGGSGPSPTAPTAPTAPQGYGY